MNSHTTDRTHDKKKQLIADLKQAVALAREIERQAKCIAQIVQDHHHMPLAA